MLAGNAEVSLLVAFGAGLASFLSPCTLPLVPVYVTYLLGSSTETDDLASSQRRLLSNALAFVLGFSVVFVLLGVSATLLGQLLLANQTLLRRAAGLLVGIFGLHLSGLVRVPWLDRQIAVNVGAQAATSGSGAMGGASRHAGPVRAFLLGIAFSAGWHPCIGPILGAILAYAGATHTLSTGILMLTAYSAGLALPFVLLAVFFEQARPLLGIMRRHSGAISRLTGLVLVVMGAAIFLDLFARLSGFVPSFLRL